MTIEIVAQSAEDAVLAERAGAHRIELVSALALGGLTPSIGLLEQTRARCGLPIVTMVRPRSGGFYYSQDERATMERDGERLREAGAGGLAFGALDKHGRIDAPANARLVDLGGEAVFHRAFDVLDDPFEGLETLIGLGFRRVLTSGGHAEAAQATDRLRTLVERADGRIEILLAGGIRTWNVARIVAETGAAQVHLAAQRWIRDGSTARSPVAFNGPPHPEDHYAVVDFPLVKDLARLFPPDPA